MVDNKLVFLEPCRPKRPGGERTARIDSLDPDAMIRSAVAGLADPATSAEDLFVAWLMALPRHLHPGEAAAILLNAYQPAGHQLHNELGRRIVVLLRETSGVAGAGRDVHPIRQGGPAARRTGKDPAD